MKEHKKEGKHRIFIADKNIFLGIIIFFMFVSSAVYGIEQIVYEDYIESGSVISLDSNDYSVFLSNNEVRIQSLQKTIEMRLLECEQIANVKFCFLDKSNDKARISVSHLLAELEIDRDIDEQIIKLGQEVKVTVDISNYGDYFVNNLSLTDDFPEEIEVFDESGDCTLTGNTINMFIEKLDVDENLNCEFYIKAKKIVDLGLTARYSYYDGFSKKEEYTPRLQIKSESGFDTAIMVGTNHDVGDEFNYEIEFSNNNDFNLDINVGVILPEGISFVDSSDFEEDDDKKIYYSFELTNDKTISMELMAKKPGIYDLITFIEYENEKLDVAETKTIKKRINVEREDLEILTNFEDDTEAAEGGQQVLLDFEIRNPNKDMNFTNIKINFNKSDVFIEPVQIKLLKPFERKNILKRTFILPKLDKKEMMDIFINIEYETQYGDSLFLTDKKTIEIEAVGTLEVDHDVTGDVKYLDKIEVQTTVSNTKLEDIDRACILETFEGFELIKGINKVCFEIDAKEDKKILSYTLKVTDKNKAKIRTNIEFERYEAKTYYENYSNVIRQDIISETVDYFKDYDVVFLASKNEDLSFEIDTDDDELYPGQISNINLELINEGNRPFFNISYKLKTNPYFDYYNSEVFIKKINPGERIYLDSGFKIRSKKEGNYKFGEDLVYFEGENEELFSNEVNKLSIDVESGNLPAQGIILTRKFDFFKNNSVYVVSNIGSKNATGFLVDNSIGLNEYFEINENANKTIKVDLDILNISNFLNKINGTQAYVKYNYLGNITTYSNFSIVDLKYINGLPEFIQEKYFNQTKIPIANDDFNSINKSIENETKENFSVELNNTKKINLTATKEPEKDEIKNTDKKNIFIALFEFLTKFFK